MLAIARARFWMTAMARTRLWMLAMNFYNLVIYICSNLYLSHECCLFNRDGTLETHYCTFHNLVDFFYFVEIPKYFSSLFCYLMSGAAHKRNPVKK